MHTQADIAKDLRKPGLARGDVVLVRVALKAIGDIDGPPAKTLIAALLDVVEESGTILGLSHTEAPRSER